MSEINGYELSRQWFDFCYENPELITPTNTALYFFIIDHCNRLGWKDKFGLPTVMAMEALGIKNYRTWSKVFTDIQKFGFVKMIQQSKNQYSSNIIAIVKNTNARTKAHTKAKLMHEQKHTPKQSETIVCIDKPITINNKPQTQIESVNQKTDDLKKIISVISDRQNLELIMVRLGYHTKFGNQAWAKFCEHFEMCCLKVLSDGEFHNKRSAFARIERYCQNWMENHKEKTEQKKQMDYSNY